ncbi:MAG TPA: hypothetical protein VGQ55_04300 [Pyrinomonadaceae bacterium]|nr:hypothetical protein [Pyrinomonadaceae bacterium]
MIRRILLAAFLLLSFLSLAAQQLPKEIRGYKVYQPKATQVRAVTNVESRQSDPVAVRGSKLVSISPAGVTFEAGIAVAPIPHNGKVDFLTFHDFTVNGVHVEIEEYASPFTIRKNEPISLQKPATVFLPTLQIVQAVWKEMRDSRAEWAVSGRVFVFGRFKKFGMEFKRVVPVNVSFTIKNPIRS